MAKKYDVVIIGGGPAGVTTALSARNTYPTKTICIIRKETLTPIPCGIPYVMHSLSSVTDNVLPDSLLQKNKIDLFIDEVLDFRNEKTLVLKSGEEVQFEKLVLATGSTPIVPPIQGIEKDGIFYVKKDLDYLEKLKQKVHEARRILIIGAGFIGIEFADELNRAGKEVVIIERLPYVLSLSIDADIAEIFEKHIQSLGIQLVTGAAVQEIYGEKKAEGVRLENGQTYPADLILIAVGYKPNTQLAQKLGLEYHEKYGIIVDEYLRTSIRDIFAVGDCAAKRNWFTGEYTSVMLASTAMAQGRLVGSNLFEIKVIKGFPGTLGTFSTKVGDLALGVTGLTEKQAQAMGIQYVIGFHESVDRHPGKLPGAKPVKVKLLFSRYSHFLLGAQVLGGDSVGELINMLSVMVQNRMTDMEIDTLQIGTHPLLTASPIAYPVINATVDAILKWYTGK